jgi:ankyrin repeat protein
MANVRLLVEAGADVNAANAYGMTPLALAVDSSLFEVASYLVEHGANPNTKCSGGVTVRELLDDIASDDYPFILSPEEANSLKYLREQLAAPNTK